MIKLSVNINKIALIRNARGGNNPNLIQSAIDCEIFGAEGITVHPRPDERHIRYSDVVELKSVLTTELNVEGNPREQKFMDLVLKVKPAQVTLVPDASNQLTSNHGWNTLTEKDYLKQIISQLKNAGIRTSIFVDPKTEMIDGACEIGTDRIELYTEYYAQHYKSDPNLAIQPYLMAAAKAQELDLGINAGHDLNLINLTDFAKKIPACLEVSIGHALICDALYYGLENTIGMYKRCLQ